MRCPFLDGDRVRYCQASAHRKMIADRGGADVRERCSTPAYVGCPAATPRLGDAAPGDRCPFLQEAWVQFCSAAPLTKYIPANDSLLSRCNSDGHLYCELYLAEADPGGARLPDVSGGREPARIGDHMVVVDGVPVPENLWFAPNHMWLDVAEDGNCHCGIDGFLAKALGAVDRVSFVKTPGVERPTAVLSVGAVDLQLVFPNPLRDRVANVYLRSEPGKLTADPYGAGWLFEGVEPTLPGAPVGAATRAGLISGESAARWIDGETDRLARFVHERIGRPGPDGSTAMADGGRVVAGILARLDRDDALELLDAFFSSRGGWRASW